MITTIASCRVQDTPARPMGRNANRLRPTLGRGPLAAILVLSLSVLSAGAPAVAQGPAPAVETIGLVRPQPDGIYALGETVQVHVGFNRQDLAVTGRPRVALTVGTDTRYAEHQYSWSVRSSDGGRFYMAFGYVVQALDRDDDGISIPANALTFNGGSIKDANGNDADLTHDAQPDNPEHKVDGSLVPPVVVERFSMGRPLTGAAFGRDERIGVSVRFSGPVVVTGNPRLVLQIGDQPRATDLSGVGLRSLSFAYFVKADDRDDDGITIPANPLRLNRGSIRDSHGNDADLTHAAVSFPEFTVNGRLDADPAIASVYLASTPLRGDTFGRGQPVWVGVRFSEPVHVTGAPRLAIRLGTQTREADLHLRRRSTLVFEYVVQSSDVDADGVSVPGDALTLDGGSIADVDGNPADLTHDALPDDPARKVNGRSGVPSVARLGFSRLPGRLDTYVAGETIFVRVGFTRAVHVAGAPRFTLQVGARTRHADHLPRLRAAALLPPRSGSHGPEEDLDSLYFQYVV